MGVLAGLAHEAHGISIGHPLAKLDGPGNYVRPVSYTHLTLPTKLEV